MLLNLKQKLSYLMDFRENPLYSHFFTIEIFIPFENGQNENVYNRQKFVYILAQDH